MSTDFNFALSPDKKVILLEMVSGETTLKVLCDAAELTTLIENLGKARAQMAPEHPVKLDPNPKFSDVTRWTAIYVDRPTVVSREVFLSLRHPGYGWLAFPLEPSIAMAVAERLAKVAREPTAKAGLLGPDGKPIA